MGTADSSRARVIDTEAPGPHSAPGDLPPGPLTTAELAAAVPDPRERARYQRIWFGFYRRADQADDLRLRSVALARTWPEGVLRGRSASLLWGDDSVPADALPEIWLPSTRRSCEGRVYRYGAMPPAAVTRIDGLRVTTPLRTCRDLALDLGFEDAVVAVERLCAAVPGLAGQLTGAAAHPSGRGAWRFAAVARGVDPSCGSVLLSRARLALCAAGFGGFGGGHEVRFGRRTVALPLADPVARYAVVPSPGPSRGEERARLEGDRMLLRRSGWTVFLVRGEVKSEVRGEVTGPATSPQNAIAHNATAHNATAHTGGHGVGGGKEVLEVLRSRWPRTEMLSPLPGNPAADPHGIWAGRRA
ncbi:hypothetical protein [Rhodococcus sp. IEGM 1408]|uniref:hypothetical protein n=1 Tax=Rhodococcus sp. IEGM 1408 TaxID=3082220 RepID=UPI0029530713|nr:hypothetical protein [Rhodococcus sp. IEGM 1408]MDV8002115.1 hypothetical protein [Rhodococcus sp. IEGM 1408]